MNKVLVIGAGGVGSVAVHKMAMNPDLFGPVTLASRTKAKCDLIAQSVKERTGTTINTAQIDADDVSATTALIERVRPDLLVNLALPYQDLNLMDACLNAGVDYMDTANYEPRDQAKFEYRWQWEYHDRFEQAGLTALLGSGFDPGVTSVFATWIRKHKLDTIRTLDILDCNGGDHGQAFATNFNPEINIREVTAPARHYEGGEWVETPALSTPQRFAFDEVGERTMYLMYHEELESLATHLPEIERIRFWMTFGEEYIKHLNSAGECRHDLDRADHLRGPGDRAAAVSEGRAAGAVHARRHDQGQDEHRRHRNRHLRTGWRRRSTSTTSATTRRPIGKRATRRSATPPACQP